MVFWIGMEEKKRVSCWKWWFRSDLDSWILWNFWTINNKNKNEVIKLKK